MHSPLRRVLGRRAVRREVQGVPLWLPWSHRLPDYAAIAPAYGQNLVELAALLAVDGGEPLKVLDVGANIGDSTLQVRNRTAARVLAVEGDPFYLDYLRRNVGDGPDVTIAPVLLTTDRDRDLAWAPNRSGGTTHFRELDAGSSAPAASGSQESLAISQLRETYPDFDTVGLIKSDTDGYDVVLIPELAAAYSGSRPVLFFEYDLGLSMSVSGVAAETMWARLEALGYDCVGFWGNWGNALGTTKIDQAGELASTLLSQGEKAPAYLDAVVVHSEDAVGQTAVAALFSSPVAGG